MQAAQGGDGDAYSRLLSDLVPLLRRTVGRRRAGAAAGDVEDLVQDVLLSIHVARASYDASRPFLPWLLAIVRNRLADGARRWGRRAAHELQVEDIEVTFSELGSNTGSGGLGEGRDLQRAMATLSPRQREAVVLLKLREMSLKEAAEASGQTVGALKVAVHRAMAVLRRRLGSPGTHGH